MNKLECVQVAYDNVSQLRKGLPALRAESRHISVKAVAEMVSGIMMPK